MVTNQYSFHKAVYSVQKIPHFAGNPLIEALPLLGSEDEVLKGLLSLPHFDHEQRKWADHERFQMIYQLENFMLPFARHIQLVYGVDSMMRQGYVGRIPHSIRSSEIFKKLHEKSLLKPAVDITPQVSGALIGMSGMGKTTTLKRFLATIPEVIHHPNYGVFQIPYLHIETPYDGASVKGLAQSIFRKVDMLLPGADYSGQFNRRSGVGAETLMNHAARLLHMHCVGLLVVDEIQNLLNSPKNRQSLMSLLVSASNELGVPILFVGTSKSRDLLTLSFRQARRSIGLGIPSWENLEKGEYDDQGDWDLFSKVLLRYQWVRNEVEVTPFLSDLLYDLSQGIVDIAIKLVATAQMRAIMDGSETLTGQLLTSVAKQELSMVSPMTDALRCSDIQALQEFDDIKPITLEELFAQTQSSYKSKRVKGASIATNYESYGRILDGVLSDIGLEKETAGILVAKPVNEVTINVADGLQSDLVTTTSGPTVAKTSSQKKRNEQPTVNLSPSDYRNALLTPNRTVLDALHELGMLPDLSNLFTC